MKAFRSISMIVLMTLVVFALTPGSTVAQGQGGGKGGGGKPPVELTNNLSMPAVHTSDAATAASWNVPAGTLGVTYSFGCDVPETVDNFSYPNTSCVDALGTFLTAAQCTAPGGPCDGLTVSRIYWQKVAENDWWAQSKGPIAPMPVAYLDWGDNLESVSWSESSTIRVEATPYASLLPWAVPFDPTTETCADAAVSYELDPLAVCQLGFQMWHVIGHGPSEQWGVRATDDAVPLPWMNETPFGVIHTAAARLSLAKLEPGAVDCPTVPGSVTPPSGFVWDTSFSPPRWVSGTGDDPCTLRDTPFTSELNVGGRYVYGYNWALKRDELSSGCGVGWSKSGWWRLTFYTGNGDVLFDPSQPVVEPLAPPPGVPSAPMSLPLYVIFAETEGTLYTGTIDYPDNLTYLDLCITSKKGGGGKGGRK